MNNIMNNGLSLDKVVYCIPSKINIKLIISSFPLTILLFSCLVL